MRVRGPRPKRTCRRTGRPRRPRRAPSCADSGCCRGPGTPSAPAGASRRDRRGLAVVDRLAAVIDRSGVREAGGRREREPGWTCRCRTRRRCRSLRRTPSVSDTSRTAVTRCGAGPEGHVRDPSRRSARRSWLTRRSGRCEGRPCGGYPPARTAAGASPTRQSRLDDLAAPGEPAARRPGADRREAGP